MIVVDSSVWIAALRNQPTPAAMRLLDLSLHEPLLVGDLVMAKVPEGARDEPHAARIERNLRQHVVRSIVSPDIAVNAARNFRMMRARGFTVRKAIDLLIGTFCIEHGHRLLHDDRDYEPMESQLGLMVVR
ncbi:type II toxin-antitoxin system VapC family toxin [Rhodopila sp.]|uniref:type II toxin-antitoxin system VapC family toxin n=1 Tax=Rhodopila sp. TaxID=2480087 RepID=UPI003D0E5148